MRWCGVTSLAVAIVACGGGCGGDESAGSGMSGGGGSGFHLPGCPAGTRPLDDGDCMAAGLTAASCGEGFELTAVGACRPILPEVACEPGMMALPGETTCRPVAPCEADPWAEISAEADVQYVSAAFTGSSDGSQAAPWKTLAQAYAAAPPGGVIAIDEGSYDGLLIDGKAVSLWGRCAEKVVIDGSEAGLGAITVTGGAHGSEAHRLAITMSVDFPAFYVTASDDILIDRVWIHDTPTSGVFVSHSEGPASATLRDSLVENAGGRCVAAHTSRLSVVRSVVRGGQPDGKVFSGQGVVGNAESTVSGSVLHIDRCLIEAARAAGVHSEFSELTVRDSAIRGTLPAVGGPLGIGLRTLGGSAHIQRCSVSGNAGANVALFGSTATIEDTAIHAATTSDVFARGLEVLPSPSGTAADVTLRGSMVGGSSDMALLVAGSRLTVDSTVIADQQAGPLASAVGILAQPGSSDPAALGSELTVRWSVVEGAFVFGIGVHLSVATLERVAIRDTRPASDDGSSGDGLFVYEVGESPLSLSSCHLQNNARAALAAFGSTAGLDGNLFECNAIDLNAEQLDGVATQLTDLGGNQCVCGSEAFDCATLSTGVVPPEPLADPAAGP